MKSIQRTKSSPRSARRSLNIKNNKERSDVARSPLRSAVAARDPRARAFHLAGRGDCGALVDGAADTAQCECPLLRSASGADADGDVACGNAAPAPAPRGRGPG